jgi:hypothetical protein
MQGCSHDIAASKQLRPKEKVPPMIEVVIFRGIPTLHFKIEAQYIMLDRMHRERVWNSDGLLKLEVRVIPSILDSKKKRKKKRIA